jgi:hypothetical protein
MVKTYQLSKNGTNGLSLKVAPMTTETELNKISCFHAYGIPDATIEPQSVLPDVSDFKVNIYRLFFLRPRFHENEKIRYNWTVLGRKNHTKICKM